MYQAGVVRLHPEDTTADRQTTFRSACEGLQICTIVLNQQDIMLAANADGNLQDRLGGPREARSAGVNWDVRQQEITLLEW